ncbi:hypothetical protein H4R34_001338 [Dimargaris verticillata]|uniref:Uncharacterized protein n=1 Tax=Dimargaris verticillata TaxID=2761393 RepID=A0A9W8EAF0_9FUNG|nr:hypothetical protein H4R34_001338 [Dimargaris verticillata]
MSYPPPNGAYQKQLPAPPPSQGYTQHPQQQQYHHQQRQQYQPPRDPHQQPPQRQPSAAGHPMNSGGSQPPPSQSAHPPAPLPGPLQRHTALLRPTALPTVGPGLSRRRTILHRAVPTARMGAAVLDRIPRAPCPGHRVLLLPCGLL